VIDQRKLLGMSDWYLRMCCSEATHQHYKGGLYRFLGPVRDADTGEPVLGKDGEPRVLYEHVWPHPHAYWVRDLSEWAGIVQRENEDPVMRFRQLGKG